MKLLRVAAPWCFALALILFIRPYTGIRHDATLYLVQGLREIHPEVFNKDLFFIAGSQADFTLFPKLLGLLLGWFEPSLVFLVLALVGRVVFYLATAFLIWAVFPPKFRWLSLLAVIVMPTGYGAFGIFSYAEPFLTARPIAEAFSLVAIGLMVRGRKFPALVALTVGFLLHPLQAIAVGVVVWCWLVGQDRRWLWCLFGGLPILVLAACGVPPFSGLFTSIDPEWRGLIEGLSEQVYLSAWTPRDWCIVVADFYLVSVACRSVGESPALRGLWRASIISGVIGLSFSALFSDYFSLMLPTGLQLWRVLWVLHWVAVASLPIIVWNEWNATGKDKVATALLVVIAIIGASVPKITLPWAILGLVPLHMIWPLVRANVSPAVRVFVLAGLGAALIAAFIRYETKAWLLYAALGAESGMVRQDVIAFSYPLVSAGFVVLACWLYRKSGEALRMGFSVVSLLALLWSASLWDSRSPWTLAMETEKPDFARLIPEEAVVYWHDADRSPLGPWLSLGRANYFSGFQLAGQMFNRDTPFIGRTRELQIDPVVVQGDVCDLIGRVGGGSNCFITKEGLAHMCTPVEGRLGPDYFVLPFDQREKIRGTWEVRNPHTGAILEKLYLYKCSDWVSILAGHSGSVRPQSGAA
ncbi:hypothetical protein [Stenotrophomonas sp. ESTM1D_MKCIP4_1]|uniref:hypothetical protein n=1 Tax=Stenotrophomonas sp. ESTM1D_MKCIP4_1 TaxID=2072414 RepID=UPI00131EDECA|nr:hypothetical protein [Stenotrophomonas sp. ESTM1D_MKCIP4_1]